MKVMSSTNTTEAVGLDDIKKADEIISMAILGPASPTSSSAAAAAPKRPNKFLASLSPNYKKNSTSNSKFAKQSQRQYTNMFPCPMLRSMDMESPEGSVSSLGLVSSAPFASMAMTSVHARRARHLYRNNRTISATSAHSYGGNNGSMVKIAAI
jgi:hypothetical protein